MSGVESDWVSPQHRRSVIWIVFLTAIAITLDGYDLVVYGTVLPTLMNDPTHIGLLSAQQAGLLGSYALIGVMVGALVAGGIGDHIGRRRMMLVSLVWFSVGMAVTATTSSFETFATVRFLTGIGIGGFVATTGAVIAEFTPRGKKNLFNGIVYAGAPAGGVLASLLAIGLLDTVGWRGMFWIGALPILVLFPLTVMKLPESPQWLLARGRVSEAENVCSKFGLPLPAVCLIEDQKMGFPALATRRYAWGTTLLGFMSFTALLLMYGLNTWLPKIMADLGYNANSSLAFLLVLNGGAIAGGLWASRIADGRGPKPVIATTFGLATLALILLTFGLPLPVLLIAVAIAGVGTTGTQMLIYGFVSNYYDTTARVAGVAWCAGFGRLGGIAGPVIGGLLIGAGLSNVISFYIFAAVAAIGMLVTCLVPTSPPQVEAKAHAHDQTGAMV